METEEAEGRGRVSGEARRCGGARGSGGRGGNQRRPGSQRSGLAPLARSLARSALTAAPARHKGLFHAQRWNGFCVCPRVPRDRRIGDLSLLPSEPLRVAGTRAPGSSLWPPRGWGE